MNSIDDTLCTDFDHVISSRRLDEGRFYTDREWAIRKANVKTLSLPNTMAGNIEFYTSKIFLENKYKLIMFNLEDKHPRIYSMLTSIGFPKPY